MGDLDRPGRVAARVRPAPAEGQGDARPAVQVADLHLPRRGHTGAQGARDDRQDLGARARGPQGQAGPQLRPRDRRRAGDRARRRVPADAADVRQRRPRRADPPADGDPRQVHPQPQAHRDRGRHPAGGDAGQRDGEARARSGVRGRGAGEPDLLQRALPGALRRGRDRGPDRARSRARGRRPGGVPRGDLGEPPGAGGARTARAAGGAHRGPGDDASVPVRARARGRGDRRAGGRGGGRGRRSDGRRRRAARGQAGLHLRGLRGASARRRPRPRSPPGWRPEG